MNYKSSNMLTILLGRAMITGEQKLMINFRCVVREFYSEISDQNLKIIF